MTGYPTPYDIEYAAKIGKLSLDTLDMSGLDVTFYSYEFDIEEREFFGSHLSRILLPKGIDAIRNEAFANCKNLKTVVLPASVERIGVEAFASSPKIEEIVIPADSKLGSVYNEAFNTGGTLTTLFIPKTANLSSKALKGLRVKALHVAITTPPALDPDTKVDRSKSTLYVPKGCKVKKSQGVDYHYQCFGFLHITVVSSIPPCREAHHAILSAVLLTYGMSLRPLVWKCPGTTTRQSCCFLTYRE